MLTLGHLANFLLSGFQSPLALSLPGAVGISIGGKQACSTSHSPESLCPKRCLLRYKQEIVSPGRNRPRIIYSIWGLLVNSIDGRRKSPRL